MRNFVRPFRIGPKGQMHEKGDTLTCPVCGKEFQVNDDTNYICAGGYVCEWKCFLKHVKETEAKKALEPQSEDTKGKKKK